MPRRIEFDAAQHRYTLAGRVFKSNTQILKGAKLVDTRNYTDEGRERGNRVHREVQREEEGDLRMDDVDEDIRPRVRAYLEFKQDTGFIAELVEIPMWHEPHRFATTPDLVGRLNGRRVLIDVKSGAVDPWNGLQLAGQDMALGERIFTRDIELDWINDTPYAEDRFILQLRKDGKYRLVPFRDPLDYQAFVGAAEIIHYADARGTTPAAFAAGRFYDPARFEDDAVRLGAAQVNAWMRTHGLGLIL
jgi:hypothetical protein